MDRLEYIREQIDQIIASIQKVESRKFAYIHTYGVAQLAALLAKLKNENIELISIAAMLHDIARYQENRPINKHALRSSEIAKEILVKSKLFNEDEINQITHAILVHSDKNKRNDGLFAEILKDADVLQHYLYNTNVALSEQERFRLYYLLEALNEISHKL